MSQAWVLVQIIDNVEYFWIAGIGLRLSEACKNVNNAIRFHREADAVQVAIHIAAPEYKAVQREVSDQEGPFLHEWLMGPDETKAPRLLTDEAAFRNAKPAIDRSTSIAQDRPDNSQDSGGPAQDSD